MKQIRQINEIAKILVKSSNLKENYLLIFKIIKLEDKMSKKIANFKFTQKN